MTTDWKHEGNHYERHEWFGEGADRRVLVCAKDGSEVRLTGEQLGELVRELPARPANEALVDAAEWHEMYAATQREAGDAKLSDRAMEQYYRTAQWHSDLAARLRAMAVGPMAEDYEAAIADVLQNPRYTHEDDIEAMVGTLADVRNRARKLARDRSES